MFNRFRSRITNSITTYPFTFFISTLVILVVLIALGQKLKKTEEQSPITPAPKRVTTYQVGQNTHITAQGKVTKQGNITIVAQTAGIIKSVRIKPGAKIAPGNIIANISATYAAGNPSDVSSQIAKTNLHFLQDNLPLQQETIRLQRELANTQDTSNDELRDINAKSIDDTKNLIDQSQSLLDNVNNQIDQLENSNTNGSNDAALAQARQGKLTLSASLNQLRSGVRTLEYQTSSDQEPASLANMSRELTNRQLDLQSKSLELNLQTAKLNTQLAQINQSLSYPTTPCAGTVEYIYVHVGQIVSPGTPIALINANQNTTTISIDLDPEQIKSINISQPALIAATQENISFLSRSSQAVNGTLGRIEYLAPLSDLTNNQYLSIQLPQITTQNISVPLDAVYQSTQTSYVYLLKDSKAVSQNIQLGTIQGEYVTVLSGINNGDQIILSRAVNSGDSVTTN